MRNNVRRNAQLSLGGEVIFGMGPLEFAFVVVFTLAVLLVVLRASLKEEPVPEQPTARDASVLARVWWLYARAWRSYAAVNGRATIREFWTFTLLNGLIARAFDAFDTVLDLPSMQDTGAFGAIFAFLIFIPTIAVTARRLHDTGRSGWWMLIVLVPFVGWFISLYQLLGAGDPGENQFGADPRQHGSVLSAQVDGGESA